jgi:hypothetical protein
MPANINEARKLFSGGNPAFAVARLLARHSPSLVEFAARRFWTLEGLPLHVITGEDETKIKPCAEF